MNELTHFAELIELHFSKYRRLSPEQISQLYSHWCLLERWNHALNLTTVAGIEESVLRHYCESLFVSIYLPERAVSVLDVGSGPGFPGVPMAIARADCAFCLAESHQRKAVFLREATRNCSNVRVEPRRAETLDTEAFDWVVSRAVRWSDVLPLVRRKGALLVGAEDSAAIVRCAGFTWQAPIALPWGERRVLVLGERMGIVPRGTSR